MEKAATEAALLLPQSVNLEGEFYFQNRTGIVSDLDCHMMIALTFEGHNGISCQLACTSAKG